VLAKLQEKCRLRAALAAVSAEIDSALPSLNAGELQELQAMMAIEVRAADADAEALRAQVAEEAALAKTQRPMQVTLARRACAILGAEAERRVQRGVFASAEALTGEAIAIAYGR
jgi:hypothetical protein